MLVVFATCNNKNETRVKNEVNIDILENDLFASQADQNDNVMEKEYVKNDDELDAISYIDYPAQIFSFGENYEILRWTNGEYEAETIYGKYKYPSKQTLLPSRKDMK